MVSSSTASSSGFGRSHRGEPMGGQHGGGNPSPGTRTTSAAGSSSAAVSSAASGNGGFFGSLKRCAFGRQGCQRCFIYTYRVTKQVSDLCWID